MASERKVVTVLFADVVGSTEHVGENDPEVVRETLRTTFKRVRTVVEQHGGVVEKFIGDAAFAVFGVPQVHEDDADRAIRAAFALRGVIEELSQTGAFPLEVRIGINTGEVVAAAGEDGELLVTGLPVNFAARLYPAAEPGEILVGPLTRRLTEQGVRYGRSRTIQAKGLGTVEASPALALTTVTPEQRHGLEGLSAPMIGRDEELQLVLAAFERTLAERRAHLVTVYGFAGAGKSRLARELVGRLADTQVRRGRCLPYGQAITYHAIQQILYEDVGITPADTAISAEAKLRTAVAAAVGADDADPIARRLLVLAGHGTRETLLPDVQASDVADELRWAVRQYFEGRAASGPLALMFEDIHWAEGALLDMIEHLAHWCRAPLFLLCLARPELLVVRPGWAGGIANAASVTLEPLSSEEARALIAALLDVDDLPETLRAEIVSRAEGNPLYVEEYLRVLIDGGQVERLTGRWVARPGVTDFRVPPTLQGLISARLDSLGPTAKDILRIGAVVGRFFSTAVVAALSVAPPDHEAFRELVLRDLITETDERAAGGGRLYRFKHVLIRDVMYESVLKADRARLHDGYGRWYERTLGERADEFVEILAYHAEEAYLMARDVRAPGSAALARRAFDLLRRAGRAARLRADARAARSLYERATAVLPDVDATAQERADAIGFAAEARRATGGRAAEVVEEWPRILELVRVGGPSEVLIDALATAMFLAQTWDERRALSDEAAAAAQAMGSPEEIAQTAMLRAEAAYTNDLVRQHGVLLEALETIRAVGASRGSAALCLSFLGSNAANRGDFAEGFARWREAYALVQSGCSKFIRARVAYQLAFGEREAGDLGRAAELFRETLALGRETGYFVVIRDATTLLAAILIERGRAAEALAIHEQLGAPGVDPFTGAIRARLLLANANLAAARQVAEDGYAMSRKLPPLARLGRAWSASSLAMVRAAEENVAAAEALWAVAFADLDGAHVRPAERIEISRERIRFLLDQRRPAEARPLIEWLRGHYADPLARRRLNEANELLRQCEALAAAEPTTFRNR